MGPKKERKVRFRWKSWTFYCWQIVANQICPLTSSTSKQNTRLLFLHFWVSNSFRCRRNFCLFCSGLSPGKRQLLSDTEKVRFRVGCFILAELSESDQIFLMRWSWLPLYQKVLGLILAVTFIWKGLDGQNMPGASFAKLSWFVLSTAAILELLCSTSFPQSSLDLTCFLLFQILYQIYAMLSSMINIEQL